MKKRYLLLAMSLTASVGFASFGHTFALQDKKQALTPPVNYDYSLRIFEGPEWNEWYFGNKNNSKQDRLIFDTATTSVVGQKHKVFSWSYQYPLGTTYGAIVMDLTVRSLFIDNIGNGGYEWLSNSMSATNSITPIVNITLTNNSPFDAYIYLDVSKNGVGTAWSYNTNGNVNFYYVVFYVNGLSLAHIPPYSVVSITNKDPSYMLDAIYIDVGSIPTGLDNAFDEYFGYGVIDEQNRTSIFDVIVVDGFFGFLNMIGNVEPLPGLKIYYIAGFVVVLSVVAFISGKKGGGS